MNEKILIIGGDSRQKHLTDILSQKGYNCQRENCTVGNVYSGLKNAKVVILPIPFSSDGKLIYSDNPDFKLDAAELSEFIKPEQLVFGGMIKGEVKDIFERNNVIYKDICDYGYFIKFNAFLTAQGALRLLLNNTGSLIVGKKVLITGFGRVGKALALILKNVNMDVYIAARSKEQLVEADCLGLKTVNLKEMSTVIYLFDYIFNTVPENIFSEADISCQKDDSIYFELASKPFGAEKSFFAKENKKYVFAGGLPGKYVARSAAGIIAELVEHML
ncbi:MAG: hypothetical protein IJ491_05805 [Clostridia bacterium]|nr:hypothetical protein [Clostridia bacterium]